MKVLLNSDILFHTGLVVSRLSRKLQVLFQACAEKGHSIVIPLTSKLEFDRSQAEYAAIEIGRIDKAYKTLDRYGIQHEVASAADRVKLPDLMRLIEESGVEAVLEAPTEEDLREAHRRACLHENPHPPQSESDEMRDLVIWMVALRISQAEGGALLISADKIHAHPRGDKEALGSGLVRVDSVENALEYFEVETPAGQWIKKWLALAWSHLRHAGLPLTERISLLYVREAKFVQGERGPSAGESYIRARTSEGKQLDALAQMELTNSTLETVTLSNIEVDGISLAPVTVHVGEPSDVEMESYAERLEALREVLGE